MNQTEANKFMANALMKMVEDGEIEDNYKNEYAIGFIISIHPRCAAGKPITPAQEKYLTDLFERDRWYVEDE